MLAIISGTRLIGGLDFITYEGHYESVPTFPTVLDYNTWDHNYEIGYTYICAFFKTIGISFYGFCLIHALFFYFCLWKGISRYTNHFGLVILFFLYKLFFYNTMISMRQSITIACFFLMLPLIENRKCVKYYICAFLVSRIHNGAYLLFVLYPFMAYFKLNKKRLLWLNIIFIPTIALGFAGVDVLGPIGTLLADNMVNEAAENKIGKYFMEENLSPIGIFHTLEYFLIMWMVYNNIGKIDQNNRKIQLSLWMFVCLLPLFTLFRASEILTREKDYFIIFYAVVLGYIMDYIPQRRRMIVTFIVLLSAFGYYRYVILFDGGHFLTYHSWLFDPYYSIFLW